LKRADVALRAAILVLAAAAAFVLLRKRPPETVHDDVSSARADALKVLFVGNSHTFVNDLPGAFGRLVSPARPLVVKDVVRGGATLSEHLEYRVAERAIRAERWDFVVLQEQSLWPTMNPGDFEASVRRFDAVIRAAGARTAIYELWPRRAGQDPVALDAIYARVARAIGALLVPVGPAWERALAADPALVLYMPDGYHPTPAGTYLAALVFARALASRDPMGAPSLGMLPDATAAELQRAAR